MKLFLDKDGTYSWRKILACIAGLTFMACSIGYVYFGFRELPKPYHRIILGVFAFYFMKEIIRNPFKK